jgi:hypothetical protein
MPYEEIRAYFHLSYRNLPYEEMGINTVRSPHYSTISRRINKLKIGINKKLGNNIVIALDSTGIKLTNKEEWMHHKWYVTIGIDIIINCSTTIPTLTVMPSILSLNHS